ncbi:MAG: chemotaxis protein CheD [Fusobacteriaceae bacterium]|jgi:chemotaxis protein CheD|nr:chemotaxis protein CheD [Fusobacteriaceae bacterium]
MNEYFLYPGYLFFSKEKYIIKTILGSCVSVCLYDKKLKFGGMNHYIFTLDDEDTNIASNGKYSTNYLIKTFLKNGSNLNDLEATIIGGASSKIIHSNIGIDNIDVAIKTLKKYKIYIKHKDIGGYRGRRVMFNNFTGNVHIELLKEINPKRDD